MSSEIDEVLFSMQVGEVSEMIRTKQGLHYIQSVDAKGEETNTFENSREEVDKDIRYQQAEEQFFDLSDQMATLAYEHPDTLDIAAEAIDIAVQESELFSRVSNKEGLLANSKIVSTSFSPEILGTGQNSEVLELSDTQLVVVRVIEHIPSSVKSLETVHDEILSDIRFLEAGRIQRESGQNILKQLQDGKTIEELETNLSIDWKQAEGASRTDVSVQRAILRSAFNLNKPTEDNPVYGGVTLGTGDYAVIVLTKVEDPEKIFEKDIDNKQLQLQQTRSGNDWDDFRQELRRRAEVQIFSDQI